MRRSQRTKCDQILTVLVRALEPRGSPDISGFNNQTTNTTVLAFTDAVANNAQSFVSMATLMKYHVMRGVYSSAYIVNATGSAKELVEYRLMRFASHTCTCWTKNPSQVDSSDVKAWCNTQSLCPLPALIDQLCTHWKPPPSLHSCPPLKPTLPHIPPPRFFLLSNIPHKIYNPRPRTSRHPTPSYRPLAQFLVNEHHF
jgi:hypothetical protein